MFILIFIFISLIFPIRLSADIDTNLKNGETVFSNYCWFCHGQKGDGVSDAAAVLKPAPKNFTDPKAASELSLDRMISSITSGRDKTAMPSFKDTLSKDEIRSVALYIKDVIMKDGKKEKSYIPHAEEFSYIDFQNISESSDLKICMLQCHVDEAFIRRRLREIKKK